MKTLIIRGFVITLLVALAGNWLDAAAQEPPTSQPQVTKRVRVSEKVSQLFLAKKVNPEYPREAREKHIQGTVKLTAVISEEGNVTDLSVISGDPALAPAAVEAVKQWKYKPYLLNGQPVAVETQVSVAFQLHPN